MLTANCYLYLAWTDHQASDGNKGCQAGQIQHAQLYITSSTIIKLLSSTPVGGEVNAKLGSSSLFSDH